MVRGCAARAVHKEVEGMRQITDAVERCMTCRFFIVILGGAGICCVNGAIDCPSANGIDKACTRYKFGTNELNREPRCTTDA
jgi:hypothetical protein